MSFASKSMPSGFFPLNTFSAVFPQLTGLLALLYQLPHHLSLGSFFSTILTPQFKKSPNIQFCLLPISTTNRRPTLTGCMGLLSPPARDLLSFGWISSRSSIRSFSSTRWKWTTSCSRRYGTSSTSQR